MQNKIIINLDNLGNLKITNNNNFEINQNLFDNKNISGEEILKTLETDKDKIENFELKKNNNFVYDNKKHKQNLTEIFEEIFSVFKQLKDFINEQDALNKKINID